MDLVCFGQQNWDYCWTGKQQLLTRLAPRGWRILYVDPDPADAPLTALDSARLLAGASPLCAEKLPWGELWRHTPRTLCAGWRASRRLDGRQLAASLDRLGFGRPIVLALRPVPLQRIEALAPLGLVYYAVDEYSGFGGMTEEERRSVRTMEEALAARADLCLGISPRLVERLARINANSFLQEGGADIEHFAAQRLDRYAAHPALTDLAGPVLGFIGQLDDRLDQDLLAAIADARPDWTIVLAGRRKPGIDFARLEACPNVRFLGYHPYTELPRVGRHVDVWLLPYVRNDLTQACNPLKVFEYLATGKPCVSVPLDGLGSCRDAVALAADADGFVAAVAAALAAPEAGRTQRLAVARANDWDGRVDALEAHLRHAAALSAARAGTTVAAARQIPAATARRRLAHDSGLDEYGQWLDEPDFRGITRLALLATGMAGAARRLLTRRRRVRRILVARHPRLGDLVAGMPMLAALRRAYPEAHIDLGMEQDPDVAALALSSGLIDGVRLLDYLWRGSPAQRLSAIAATFAAGYDLVVSGSKWFFLPEAMLAGAGRTVGSFDGHPMQAAHGTLLPRDYGRHEADNNLDLVAALTNRPMEGFRQPLLPLDEGLVRQRAAELAPLLPPAGAPLLMVHPGANRASRRWPEDLLATALARLLERHGNLHLAFSGIASERPLVGAVMAALPPKLAARARDLSGRTDVFGMMALLDRAAVLLCNDTGVMHVARARGTPLVATLGPENPHLWGPYPHGPAPAAILRAAVPCAPCARRSCDALYCLRSITPERVADAVSALLAAERRPRGGSAVARDQRRLAWSDLAAAGHAVPLVSVVHVLRPGLEADVAATIAEVERQTYPAVEIIVVDRAGTGWRDRRDKRARRALSLRLVTAANDGAVWPAALAAAHGSLLLRHATGEEWWPGKIAAGVAAAMRVPEAPAFDGEMPQRAAMLDGGLVRRDALAALLGLNRAPMSILAGRHAAE